MVARPDQDMLIAGIAQQGLWTSTGGSDTWSKLGAGAGSATITNRASTIIVDPDNPATFWESGTYNGGGVYRTDDNGVTFRQLGDLTHVEGLSVDLSDPARKTLLATIHESSNTFVSTNGGKSWKDITSTLPADVGYATGPVVIDQTTFLLGTSNAAGSKVLRSTDAGVSWTTVYDGGVLGSPLRAQSDGVLYWFLDSVNGMIGSIDNGQTWTVIPPKGPTPPTSSASALLELPDASLASISGDRVVISADHAASWTAVGPPIPITPNGMIYSPFRKAFYVWHFDCDFSTADPIQPDSIVRFDFDLAAQ
ncbi:MAG: WD40/YVTN/BNR-like repeat-containing protein [Ilumatobacteraceae bacterium]